LVILFSTVSKDNKKRQQQKRKEKEKRKTTLFNEKVSNALF
jgi:hypothetical protein